MAVHKYLSPNGDPIVQILEQVIALASVEGIDDEGNPLYGSTGSSMDWDNQTSVLRDGKLVYVCEGGNQWFFDQLVKSEEIPE